MSAPAFDRAGERGADSTTTEHSKARGWRSLAPRPRGNGAPLSMTNVSCDLCGPTEVEPVGVGEDFEYWTSPDTFVAVRCKSCGLVYLDPRPTESELGRIYPSTYHAFDFTAERYGLVHRVRSWLEAKRLLRAAKGLPAKSKVLDIGCGDGFHLDLLRRFGPKGWTLEGVEPDERAAVAAADRSIVVHPSTLEDADIPDGSVDLALLIQTIEHVPDPTELLTQIRRVLRPSGRLMIVTDNVGSPDFKLFGSRHWGGYHFPRHWHLYDRSTLTATASRAGLDVVSLGTIVSPVNWTYSVRNLLVDLNAPEWLIRPFSLEGAAALAVGTVVDLPLALTGRGALLCATFTPGMDYDRK